MVSPYHKRQPFVKGGNVLLYPLVKKLRGMTIAYVNIS